MLVLRFDRSIRRRWLTALSFFAALLLVRGGLEPMAAVPVTTGNSIPVRELATTGNEVVLTFNVTWGERIPAALIERLAKHDIRAVFFVSGPWAAANPELIERMVAGGHDVGALGHEIVNLTAAQPDQIRKEIAAATNSLRNNGVSNPQYFRPPGGAYDDQVLAAIADHGLRTILWSVDGRDWLQPGAAVIAETVVNNVRPGSIVLLHGSDNNEQTLQAIDEIVRGLQVKNLLTTTLSQLSNQ